MKTIFLAAILLCLSPALALSASARKAGPRQIPTELSEDLPMTVGIKPSLPFVKTGAQLGRWGVGNGGDWLRISFARARDYAANIVLRINPNSLSRIKQPVLRQWLLDHQKLLAADILQTEHVWVAEAKPSCAWTVPPGADVDVPVSNPIEFSYPTCRESLACANSQKAETAGSFLEIAQLLIHEASHHFNASESLADQVAIAVIDAWQSGLMDATPIELENAPLGTQKHSAVWTGDAMVVFGGYNDETASSVASASSFDPLKGTWTDLNPPTWLSPRHDALSLWTGTEVLIWGGFQTAASSTDWLYDGALYNPASHVWTPLSRPSWWTPKTFTWDSDPRQSMVWTGDRAIVWGGIDQVTGQALGAMFDPKSRTWLKMNSESKNAPLRIAGATAVWTGKSMIVWGGYKGSADSNRTITDEGSIYDPIADSWTPIMSGRAQGTPSARAGHQAVWIGNKMVVISGGGVASSTDLSSTGGIYDPTTDTWSNFQSELMAERVGHKMVWNGEEILLIGGRSNRLKTLFGEVYGFNPLTLRWRVLSGSALPVRRVYSSIVWTGSSALVWGGYAGDSKTQRSGSFYYP